MKPNTKDKFVIIEHSSLPEVDEPPLHWILKRKRTQYVFFLQTFSLGIEYSVFFLTLWLYIEQLIRPNNPKVIYSLTSASYLVAAVVLSVVVAPIADKYRCIRKLFLICNTFVITGNLIYALPFSPSCLIVGRLIAGAGAPLKAVITGEIARSYPPKESISKFSLIGLAFSTGFICGPAINIAFTGTNFSIGKWHITEVNVPGLYMAVLFLILQVVVFFFAHDLSKEYDLKMLRAITFENGNVPAKFNNEKKPLVSKGTFNSIQSMFILFTRLDSGLILFLSYFFMYLMVSFDMWMPIMVVDVLKWKPLTLNLIIFGSAFVGGVVLLVMMWRPVSEAFLNYLMLTSLIAMIIMQGIFVLLKTYHDRNTVVIPLWCLWIPLFTIVCVMENVYLVNTLARMVSSTKQATAESIRLGLARSGSLTALLSSVYLFDWLNVYAVSMTCLCVLGTLLFVSQWKKLKTPVEIL